MPDFKPDAIKPAWQLPFEGSWPMAVAFLGSHRRLAAANQEGTILVWDLPESPEKGKIKDEQGKEVEGVVAPPPALRLEGHANGVTHLVASDDGKTLVSSSLDRTVRVWDLAAEPTGSGEVIVDKERRERASKRVEKDKRQAILEAPGAKVKTQQAAATLEGQRDWIQSLGRSFDGKRIISGDDSGLAIVWDLAARKEVKRWQCSGVAWILAAALSPDGQTAIVAQYRRKGGDYNNYPAHLRLYDVASGEMKLDILAVLYPKEKNPKYQYQYEYHKFVAEGLVAASFSPDGKLIAVGQGGEGGDGKVHLIEAETGKVARAVSGHQYGVTDVAFTKDSKHLFTVGRDTTFRIIRVADGQEVAKIGKPRGGQFYDWLSALSLSPDEKWLAASDIGGFVQVWQLG